MHEKSVRWVVGSILVISWAALASRAQVANPRQEDRSSTGVQVPAAETNRFHPAKGPGTAVFCEVEKGGMILSLLPERALVKKGDIVCEMDASELKDLLGDLVIATKRAEADYQDAERQREIADLEVREYMEGTFLQIKATILGEIKLAESELARAGDHLDQAQRQWEKGTISKAEKVASELMFQKAKFALEVAQGKLNMYENFSKTRAIKQVKSTAVRALADAAIKREIWELARDKEEKTRRQIEKCRIVAPCDGRVLHSSRPPHPGEREPYSVEEGDIVRERQEIIRVVPSAP